MEGRKERWIKGAREAGREGGREGGTGGKEGRRAAGKMRRILGNMKA